MKNALLFVMLLFCGRSVPAQLHIAAALCENKINPLGVAFQNLRFGWELKFSENNQSQTAYQVVTLIPKRPCIYRLRPPPAFT